MGYEMKIYVGEVAHVMAKPNGTAWFRVLGMVELFKVGDSFVRQLPKDGTPIYMYDLDGDTEYSEDRYGDKLVALDAHKILEALRQDLAAWPNAPTLRAAVAMLSALLESETEAPNLLNREGTRPISVVLYGH